MPRPSERITSRANPLVRKFREVAAGKEEGLILLEGVRFLEEALRARFPLETVIYSERLSERPRGPELLEGLKAAKVSLFPATEEVLAAVSDVETPQGVAALAPRPSRPIDHLFVAAESPFLLVAAGIRDPGNLGSLIRTADAAGASGVAVAESTASPFNSKAVRSSMGSILRLPVVDRVPVGELLRELQNRNVRIVATDSCSGVEFRDADYSGPIALCLGAEAEGIPDEVRKAAALTVRIRLHHGVESLNVAAAGAILLFEIAERRKP